MPASNLLVVALATALQAPAGFQTVPIDGKTQVMVARKGDVYFIVRDLPGVLSSSAKPADVVARLVTEATSRPKASWDSAGGIEVIKFSWGDDELGATGMIGARGSRSRVATCQWGVGLKRAEAAERKVAIDACQRALAQVPGFEAPPATGGGAPAGESPPGQELPFKPPEGFEWRSDGAGGWLGMRGGSPEKGGGEGMGGYELPLVFDTRMDLSRVTDEVADVVAEGLNLQSLEVAKLGTVDVIHFNGRVGQAGATGAAVEGYLVPRGRTTFLLFVMKQAAVSPELSESLRAAAASVEGMAAPAVDRNATAPDAGVPGAAKKKPAPAKKGADDWKAALVVVSLLVVAVGLAVVMGLGRSRRRRRRGETSPPDPTPSA
jgi:hypothetical protein